MWGRRLERVPKVRLPGQAQAIYCFDPKRTVQSSKYIAKAEAQQSFQARDRRYPKFSPEPSQKYCLARTTSTDFPNKQFGSGFPENERCLWLSNTSRVPLRPLANLQSVRTNQGSEILHRRPERLDVNDGDRRPRNGTHRFWSY